MHTCMSGNMYECVHYAIQLSNLCRPVWRHWTWKMLVRYILSNKCLRWSEFSQLSFMQYMGLCLFSLPIPLVMLIRICVFIIIKSKVWSSSHCVGSGHEMMACPVCLAMFLHIKLLMYNSWFTRGCILWVCMCVFLFDMRKTIHYNRMFFFWQIPLVDAVWSQSMKYDGCVRILRDLR